MAERNESNYVEIPGMSSGESDPVAALKELQEYFSECPGGLVDDFEEDLEEGDCKHFAYGCNGADIQGDSAGIQGDGLFTKYRVDELKATEREILKIPEGTEFTDDVTVEKGIQIHTIKFESSEEDDESSEEDESSEGDEEGEGKENGENQTDATDKKESKVPLVMVHGLGGSILAFHKNYRKLSTSRMIYGIDLPGFGLSSRKVKFPCSKEKYPKDCKKALKLASKSEKRMIELFEKWRETMGIEEMILLGHSFGGYISARYSLAYPDRVRHLVMVDPWGVFSENECRDLSVESDGWNKRGILKKLAMMISRPWRLNPLDFSRAGGNAVGVLLMKVVVPDSQKEAYGDETMKYFVDVNMGKPSGERLFSVLSGYNYVFPMTSLKSSMVDEGVRRPHITFIYGKESNFHSPGVQLLKSLPNITVEEVDGAGHHVHAEKAGVFHQIMKEIFKKVD